MTEGTDFEVGRFALRTFVARYTDREERQARLGSLMAQRDDWADGTASARCLAWDSNFAFWSPGVYLPPHEAPHAPCTCGIYGALTLATLEDQYPQWTRRIVGVIAAEGKTMIGSVGLRTQHARVVAYYGDWRYRRLAAKQFQGAESYRNMDRMLETYGLQRGRRTGQQVTWAADWWNQGQVEEG